MNDKTGMTSYEKQAGRRYVWEFGVGMALFLMLFLLLPDWWHTDPGTWPHLVRTLVPILPLLWAVAALWRHLWRIDEMQRAVLVRSFAFGFAVTMFTTLVIALLRGGGIDVPGSEWIIFIAGMISWSIAIPVNTMKSGR